MRWLPVLTMMLVSLISYLDRNTLALLAPTILHETHLSAEQYGFIISGFSIAYMLGNPVWGAIIDRIGLRKGMTASVTVWTIASLSHAFAGGFASFAAARAVLGFGEGATFPGSMRTAMQTLPVEHRSRGIAISYSGGSLGAVITPLIITPVAAVWGWRGAFWFTGAVGALWVSYWLWLSRSKPFQQPITRVADAVKTERSPNWNHRRTWAFMFAYALGSMPLGFVLYETSLYLSAVLHKTQIEIGEVLWIPPVGWELGYFFFGWVSDRYLGSGTNFPRMQALFLALTVASLSFALAPLTESFVLTMFLLFLATFLAAGFIIGSLAYANAYYSENHSGLIAGLGAGSWSAMVALVMPGFGRLFDLHQYELAFLLSSLFPILGFAGWRVLHGSSARSAS